MRAAILAESYKQQAQGLERSIYFLNRELAYLKDNMYFNEAMASYECYDPMDPINQAYTLSWDDIYEDCGGRKPRETTGVAR